MKTILLTLVLTVLWVSPISAFEISVSEPTWIAGPHKQMLDPQLPDELVLNRSNNNVGLAVFNGRRFIAFRTAPTHFASKKTRMIILSSGDDGQSWQLEKELWVGADIREPFFLNFKNRLFFTFMVLGKKMLSFDPQRAMRIEYLGQTGKWSQPEQILEPHEMVWEIKSRNGEAWMTSYVGEHYKSGTSKIHVNFRHSHDGITWEPVRKDGNPTVYIGGVSEVGFDFDPEGNLWAVTRNEDGDQSGWGSHIVTASASDLGDWQFPKRSNPIRHDSPRMFQWNGELFLIARKDFGGNYDRGFRRLGFGFQKWIYLLRYWFTSKTTVISWLNRSTGQLEEVAKLPGNGDTAFPSIVQLDDNTFWVANYTNSLGHPRMPWVRGQLTRKGTWIYTVEVKFKK
jgi:hypothetical protein